MGCLALGSCLYGCSAHLRSESEGGFGTYLVVDHPGQRPQANAPPPANHPNHYSHPAGNGTNDFIAAPPPGYDFESGSARISNATTNSLSVPGGSTSETYMRNSSMEC